MEAMESGKELENSEWTPKKKGPKRKRQMKESNSKSCIAGAPRTRSHVAPDWTTKELLILVNEISAVEGDCLKALSSYQKWRIIVENCTALDVPRTLNQCRSKWNSLIAGYNQIKRWDSKSNTDSYWILDCEKRKQFQLPDNFDNDLFIAIDNYVKAQTNHPDTDPDTDPEAEADLLNVIAKLGYKRHRRRSMSLKIQTEEKPSNCCAIEWPQEIHAEVEPQKSCEEVNTQIFIEKETPQVFYDGQELLEEKSRESCRKEEPQTLNVAEIPRESLVEENAKIICRQENKMTEKQMAVEKPKIIGKRKNKIMGTEEERQMVVEKPKIIPKLKDKKMGTEEEKQMAVQKLCENAQLIHAIVQGNFPERADSGVNDMKSVQGFHQTDFARRQGDKIIACLGDMVNILHKFPCLVQECD